jgi:hypothetical protein
MPSNFNNLRLQHGMFRATDFSQLYLAGGKKKRALPCGAIITHVKEAITRNHEMPNYVCDAQYSETSADAAETFFERATA